MLFFLDLASVAANIDLPLSDFHIWLKTKSHLGRKKNLKPKQLRSISQQAWEQLSVKQKLELERPKARARRPGADV